MLRALKPVIFLFGVLGTLVILALGFLCMASGPTFTYRYRLTIEVDTPHGPKSGSSVIETTLQNNHEVKWAPPEARKFTARARGEAVFVDLGDDRHVIGLLAMGPTAKDDPEFRKIVPGALAVRWDTPNETIPAIVAAVARGGGIDVPAKSIPTLITFHALSNPDSAQVVPSDDFVGVFGPGYAFRRATVELVPVGVWPLNLVGLTGVPLSYSIDRKLPAILEILRERNKRPSVHHWRDPYRPASGHLVVK
ncbi:MAG TPA: hypothetical protein VNZ50_14360 [Hyphomicrobiaceae bacterium]|nr:hypothetical protein [Hyphomicrobiaceae bacterium]